MKPLILGIAGSLRNARWGAGNRELVTDLLACASEEELRGYLQTQAQLHLQQFIEAGRAEGLAFDAIYKNLQKLKGDQGLSNSEVALAAALWAAARAGCEVERVSLSEYFPAGGVSRHTEALKEKLRSADGILVSTPVYFGDRGSLAQDLIDLIRNDTALRADLHGTIYAGLAVGAKRNGGQETTLIYQLFDMVNLGLLGVGNDSDTTSQYGGTGCAGDVGTMANDEYGLWTAMGTGRRIAKVAALSRLGHLTELRGKVRVMFWILQDRDNRALRFVESLVAPHASTLDATIIDATGKHIKRCIACDICPTHVDVDESYRCIIRAGRTDEMGALHNDFLDHDAIIPVVYCPHDRTGLVSNYQRFIERTRYLRRGDYVFTDCLTAPLVLEDLGVIENMHMRMATSLIRHHTIVTEPMIAYLQDGHLLNAEQIEDKFSRFLSNTHRLTSGRLRSFVNGAQQGLSKYNPVGYILSTEKDKEDEKLKVRVRMVNGRQERVAEDARQRLAL